jgi:hypothetical protein
MAAEVPVRRSSQGTVSSHYSFDEMLSEVVTLVAVSVVNRDLEWGRRAHCRSKDFSNESSTIVISEQA